MAKSDETETSVAKTATQTIAKARVAKVQQDQERKKTEAVDELAKAHINLSDLETGLKAVELGVSQRIRNILLIAFLDKTSSRGIVFINSIFKLVELGVSSETLVCLARVAVKENWVTGTGYKIKERLPESRIVMESIMKEAMATGNTTVARVIANLRKSPLTTNEINALVQVNCLKGNLDIAKDAAGLAKRELTIEEINTLTKALKPEISK